MQTPESWGELQFDLTCLNSKSAKKQFRTFIRYSFGGLCAYCRSKRALTVDHLKPRSRGGSNLRSNLIPCCLECNQSKASAPCWLTWYKQQEFYSEVAKELIEEWITNTRNDEDYYEPHCNAQSLDRTTICTNTCSIRSHKDESTCIRKNSIEIIENEDGAEKRATAIPS